MFGIRFEKDGPGIEYNSLGLNGGFITVLAKFFNEAHWAAQLRHYNPDLVIINYGTNESVYERFVDTIFEDELALAIGRIRRALPECSILLMSPMDRGTRMSDGEIGTVPALLRVVAAKQRVAAREACAFFNTFDAMGGAGTMGRWYAAEPRLVGADFIHPMPAGAKIVGNLLYKALLSGYNEYKANLIKERMAVLPRQGAN
jgi:lysophospholipase L1-like esterase